LFEAVPLPFVQEKKRSHTTAVDSRSVIKAWSVQRIIESPVVQV
jgi:hypothetical protein